MGTTIKRTTTRHTNGSMSRHHTVVRSHPGVEAPRLHSLNDVMQRGPHDWGSAPRGRVQPPPRPVLRRP